MKILNQTTRIFFLELFYMWQKSSSENGISVKLLS